MKEDDKQPQTDAALNEETSSGSSADEGESAPEEAPAVPESEVSLTDPKPTRKRGAPKEEVSRKLTKKEILAHLAKKNEVILGLMEKNKMSEAENKNLKDKWLRTAAEFENYRKRTHKEWELLQQQTKAEVIVEILNMVDDLERAFSVVGERNDEFIQGIRLIYNNLLSTLGKLGVSRIEALDSIFDPNYHMAVAQIEGEGAEPNQVVEVIQHGYLLGAVVIRPAKVVIAK